MNCWLSRVPQTATDIELWLEAAEAPFGGAIRNDYSLRTFPNIKAGGIQIIRSVSRSTIDPFCKHLSRYNGGPADASQAQLERA